MNCQQLQHSNSMTCTLDEHGTCMIDGMHFMPYATVSRARPTDYFSWYWEHGYVQMSIFRDKSLTRKKNAIEELWVPVMSSEKFSEIKSWGNDVFEKALLGAHTAARKKALSIGVRGSHNLAYFTHELAFMRQWNCHILDGFLFDSTVASIPSSGRGIIEESEDLTHSKKVAATVLKDEVSVFVKFRGRIFRPSQVSNFLPGDEIQQGREFLGRVSFSCRDQIDEVWISVEMTSGAYNAFKSKYAVHLGAYLYALHTALSKETPRPITTDFEKAAVEQWKQVVKLGIPCTESMIRMAFDFTIFNNDIYIGPLPVVTFEPKKESTGKSYLIDNDDDEYTGGYYDNFDGLCEKIEIPDDEDKSISVSEIKFYGNSYTVVSGKPRAYSVAHTRALERFKKAGEYAAFWEEECNVCPGDKVAERARSHAIKLKGIMQDIAEALAPGAQNTKILTDRSIIDPYSAVWW